MGAASGERDHREFLAGIRVGDLWGGTVAEVERSRVTVVLDGFPARPLGIIWAHDVSWSSSPSEVMKAGRWITAEVIAVDVEEGRARLATTATENPELWAFLKSRRSGEILSGTVAAVEPFGVFLALEDGPEHPVLPGVGFITIPELSWRHVEAVSDVVQVGHHVSCVFLGFDTWYGEARLSLRAARPDPFQVFADSVTAGEVLRGKVTRMITFGVFVRVADGVEGLLHAREFALDRPATARPAVEAGDEIAVVVLDVDRQRRRLTLSRYRSSADSR
ncbi:S1 RNA-binding domain-containing protein [Streptomyces sp. wa13]|uniref:S1 RNA-binding domain-containing protein n=1 Tax=Streptomyces sp. wa13 TaxID=1828236 RepID=UPI003C7A00F0